MTGCLFCDLRTFAHGTREGVMEMVRLAKACEPRPSYWPQTVPWPLEDGVTILGVLESYPPQFKLSNGKTIRGVMEDETDHY